MKIAQEFINFLLNGGEADDNSEENSNNEGNDGDEGAETTFMEPSKSVVAREQLLTIDSNQEREFANVKMIIEDSLFDRPQLNVAGGWTYRDMYLAAARHPLQSLIATMSHSAFMNNVLAGNFGQTKAILAKRRHVTQGGMKDANACAHATMRYA